MKLIFTLGLIFATGFASAGAYTGDGKGLDIEHLSPPISERAGDDATLVFFDPVCVACRQMIKVLGECEINDNVHFIVVASTQQTTQTLENKFWYLSSGGDLPASNVGCQENCSSFEHLQETEHKIKDKSNMDSLFRINRLARNTSMWKKYLGQNAVTPSYLDLKDMRGATIENEEDAKKVVGCI